MARLQLHLPSTTDRSLRMYIARTGGKKGDLSKFVDEAVRGEIFRRTVHEIQERNTDVTEEEAMRIATEAVNEARADLS